MSESIGADVTIVGAGIAGLWSAKELIDRGFSVNIVETSNFLANGATTKNEGWLHAGTYHSIGIENEADANSVTSGIRLSHESIIDFAPESIDHKSSFAVVTSDSLAHKAVTRWEQTGVGYQEVGANDIPDNDTLDISRLQAFFKVEDKSINTYALCQKLAQYAVRSGADIIMNADFIPEDGSTATVRTGEGEVYTLKSNHFLVTAGVGVRDIVKKITGEELPTRFFKAHLLVLPRLTIDNYFHLDAGESGFMNHGATSIVAVNRDGIELSSPDNEVVEEKRKLARNSLIRMVPSAARHDVEGSIATIVCNKPDVTGDFGDTQSLDVNIFEPAPGYTCALPGKMTMAPYLAKKVANKLDGEGRKTVGEKMQGSVIAQSTVQIASRPADLWMQSRRATSKAKSHA